jgi:hypothetical protein
MRNWLSIMLAHALAAVLIALGAVAGYGYARLTEQSYCGPDDEPVALAVEVRI